MAAFKNKPAPRSAGQSKLQRAWQTASRATQAAELAALTGRRADALQALSDAKAAKAAVEAAWRAALADQTPTSTERN
jgi:hypothetical protein